MVFFMPPNHDPVYRPCYQLLAGICLCAFLKHSVNGQTDSLPVVPDFLQDQVESYLDNLDNESDFDFNSLGENLQEYRLAPLSLNQADREDLESLHLLSDIQIADYLYYRKTLGDLTSIYELQAIPSFDPLTISSLLPFVTVEENRSISAGSLLKMLTTGKNELYLRTTRILEEQKGYRPVNNANPAYSGGPGQHYVRFQHRFQQKLRFGFTLEKDPGEPIFQGINRHSFDYTSFHFFGQDLGKNLRALVLGDYAVSLGQGLIMHSGYGGGKSAFVTNIKRGGRVLRPYTSVNEDARLRGLATTLQFNAWHLTFFASRNKQDANIVADNDLASGFTSLQMSGLHRTPSEIEDKDAITHHLLGGRIAYRKSTFQLGLNALTNSFDLPFQRPLQPYNQFYFRGTRLSNASLDYQGFYRNIYLFGETAGSDNGAVATLHGLLLSVSRYIDLAILYRNYSRNYQALQANSLSETSQASNERGMYIGTQIKLSPACWINIYGDYWKHPWLRFGIDSPSGGTEHLFRITYHQKRKLEAYLQYRNEFKATNYRTESQKINQLFYRSRKNLRLHLKHRIHPNLELRNRLEFSHITTADASVSRGMLIYQDIIFRSIRRPLSFTARVSYFDTDGYLARIYAYENDILYSFSIPAYFNQGIRYYLNLRYRINNLTLEARIEQTRYRNLEVISSGNEQIDGNTRSRIKLQCRYIF